MGFTTMALRTTIVYMARTSQKPSNGKPEKAAAAQMTTVPEKTLQVFGNKPFMRFVKAFGASHDDLLEMITEVPDADLGGDVFKFRLARDGEGKSGGARTIVAMKVNERVVMMFGFEKKDQDNITTRELKAFKKLAKEYLERTTTEMEKLVKLGALIKIQPSGGGKAK